jgi:hypothetical protein
VHSDQRGREGGGDLIVMCVLQSPPRSSQSSEPDDQKPPYKNRLRTAACMSFLSLPHPASC